MNTVCYRKQSHSPLVQEKDIYAPTTAETTREWKCIMSLEIAQGMQTSNIN